MSESIKLERVILHRMNMQLQRPFQTSFGTTYDRRFLLVEVVDSNGVSGWGECVAGEEPWYSEETCATCEHIIVDYLLPLLQKATFSHPNELSARFSPVRRNCMAKSSLEGAVWDLYGKRAGRSLASLLGGVRDEVEVGVSIGVQPSIPELLDFIEERVAQGYKRVKIKIMPGWDMNALEAVRKVFPEIPLMADANSAYTLKDLDYLKGLDQFNLTMVEQPLAHDDIIDHAALQMALNTPVCLDESIHSLDDTRKALHLDSCRIINVKIGRVGGLTDSLAIHDFCASRGIPLWCGGMLESGVGRAHNLAITSLPGFTMPGDTAASSHYWAEDIIEPEVTVENGLAQVPSEPGIGVRVLRERVKKFRESQKVIKVR